MKNKIWLNKFYLGLNFTRLFTSGNFDKHYKALYPDDNSICKCSSKFCSIFEDLPSISLDQIAKLIRSIQIKRK